MAATVGAGIQDFELYAYANQSNVVIVGGSNPTVGVAGWSQGGGHGPLSSSYGMGADNILQATVVLASGEIVTANEFQNPDLYWALRGGGGGTFGVVTEMVVKAFPSPKTTVFLLTIIQSNITEESTASFWSLMATMHREFIGWKAAGMQGYYGILGAPLSPVLYMTGGWYLYDKANGTADGAFAAFKTVLDAAVDKGYVTYNTSVIHAATFYDFWYPPGPEPVASGGSQYGSRLLTKKALSQGDDVIAKTFQEIGPKATVSVRPSFYSI